jgi:hypothetical protein
VQSESRLITEVARDFSHKLPVGRL